MSNTVHFYCPLSLTNIVMASRDLHPACIQFTHPHSLHNHVSVELVRQPRIVYSATDMSTYSIIAIIKIHSNLPLALRLFSQNVSRRMRSSGLFLGIKLSRCICNLYINFSYFLLNHSPAPMPKIKATIIPITQKNMHAE